MPAFSYLKTPIGVQKYLSYIHIPHWYIKLFNGVPRSLPGSHLRVRLNRAWRRTIFRMDAGEKLSTPLSQLQLFLVSTD